MFLYKISSLRQLLAEYFSLVLNYAQTLRCKWNSDSGDLKRIVFSGEYIIHTNGVVMEHNARVCGLDSTCAVEYVPVRSDGDMVWCKV